jgi:hypothetical protein
VELQELLQGPDFGYLKPLFAEHRSHGTTKRGIDSFAKVDCVCGFVARLSALSRWRTP